MRRAWTIGLTVLLLATAGCAAEKHRAGAGEGEGEGGEGEGEGEGEGGEGEGEGEGGEGEGEGDGELLDGGVTDSGSPADGGSPTDGGSPADGGSPTDGGSPADSGDEEDLGPQPECMPGTSWTPGTPIFREVTTAWGLAEIGAGGVRLNALDYDGDGWVDLLVRRTDAAEDFSAPALRGKWLLRNTGAGRFEDVTRASGLLAPRLPGGAETSGRPVSVAAAADVDNDGDLDVYLGTAVHDPAAAGVETPELLLNRGDGTFELGPAESGLRMVGQPTVPAAAAFTDVDRDGRIDLWTPQNMISGASEPLQDRLYLGDGRGAFADATVDLGLRTRAWRFMRDMNGGLAHTWAWSGAACDLNGDGTPELLAASYGRAPNHLWLGVPGADGGVSFQNVSVASGYAFDERTDWTDNESARCWCHLHPETEDCDGVPAPQYIRCTSDEDAFRWSHDVDREPFRLGGNSGATICAEVNGDGRLDLLTTEIVHWDVGQTSDPSELLFNTGDPSVRFERPGNEVTGLTRTHRGVDWNDGDMSGAVFDFDNDGRPDVYIGASDYPGNRGLLWHQRAAERGRFEAVATADFFEHNRSHGVVAADFDRDGDLDLAVGHSVARCDAGAPNNCYATQQIRLFENVLGNTRGSWLQLKLEGGAGANRSAIGARVTVQAGRLRQLQEVDGGHGHFGTQRDLVLHFGLATACAADVTVRWPDAALTTATARLDAGHRWRWVQGAEPVLDDAPAAPPAGSGRARPRASQR